MHRAEFGVRRDAVITFKEILDDQLPIGGCRVAARMRNPSISDAVIVEDWPHIAKGRIEIVRLVLAHIDEDQPVENANVAREKAVFGLVKILWHQPRGNQPTVEAECPGVIGAD